MAQDDLEPLEVDNNLKEVFSSDDEGNASPTHKYVLKERYTIDFSHPFPELDVNGASAYKVEDKADKQKELFALICNNDTAPRSSLMLYLKSADHISIMKLVEFGVVINPDENSKKMGLIYQKPLGGKVMDSPRGDLEKNSEYYKSVLLRLLSAVETLKGYGITHRAIRPDNLYYKDAGRMEIILGDCLASFPAFHQPPICETIESLAAQPEGRGNGSDADDFYAVGATVLGLYLNRALMPKYSLPEVRRLKIKKGSYQALVEDDIVPNFFANIFKGLLNDNRNSRWGYLQAYNYLEGKSSSVHSSRHERPKKSITINGEKVYSTRDVVWAMQNSISETYELIKSGKIMDWVKHGVGDDILADKIEKTILVGLKSSLRPDILVARVCMIMVPSMPIRVGGLSLFPDGASKAVYYALRKQYNLAPFFDLFLSGVINAWYQEQENLRSPSNVNEFQTYVNSRDIGFGLDRIMYDFDPDLPCVSPLLGDNFVNSTTKILMALDSTYATHSISSPPYDNTIIAYLRCKLGRKVDSMVINLNSKKEDVRALSILKLYTMLQKKYGPSQLLNLSAWLSNYLKPIIKSYNSLRYQKYLEREMAKISKRGKLYELQFLLENAEARKKDMNDYNEAVKEINALLSEKSRIMGKDNKLNEEARDIALKCSAVMSIVIMVVSFVFNVMNLVIK